MPDRLNLRATFSLVFLLAAFLLVAGAAAQAAAPADKDKPKAPAAKQEKQLRAEDVVPPDARTQEDFLSEQPMARREPAPTVSVWRMLFSLLLVIGLILAITYGMKYVWARGIRLDVRGRRMRVLDTLQLGVNRTIFLVRVGRRVVLLGTAEKGIQFLTEITDPVELEEMAADEEEGPAPAGFAGHLDRAIQAQSASRPVSFADRLKERLSRINPDNPEDHDTNG